MMASAPAKLKKKAPRPAPAAPRPIPRPANPLFGFPPPTAAADCLSFLPNLFSREVSKASRFLRFLLPVKPLTALPS